MIACKDMSRVNGYVLLRGLPSHPSHLPDLSPRPQGLILDLLLLGLTHPLILLLPSPLSPPLPRA